MLFQFIIKNFIQKDVESMAVIYATLIIKARKPLLMYLRKSRTK
jgi:hypothetical protein